ncbi:PQQ-binding-like beta-propeller repeat protein [Haladaptatus caseinilyticus]|uniref:PQQ-binding-like beta-propeller repeat protein n=1 Tax=Haladaptatus caseinilyticus TaxID=2993314 RepID=UPI00224B0B43|nr:PQQ-binding-like beta-propeller repeat protein [Haladaptatus caseinilyticus]
MGAVSLESTAAAAQKDNNNIRKDINWNTARANAQRTGTINTSGPTPYTATKWKRNLAGSMFSKEPVVADGTVYLAVTTNSDPTEGGGFIGAYDIETGNQQWIQSDYPSPKTPTVGESLIYFATNVPEISKENKGGLYGVERESGDTVWSRKDTLKWTSPIVVGSRLYTSNSDGAYALNRKSGETIWRTKDIGMLTDGGDGALSYANGTIFFSDGTALNAADGSVKWRVTDSNSAFANHTIVDNRVYYLRTKYVENDNDVVTVESRSVRDGTVDWSHEIGGKNIIDRRFAVADGHVLFFDSERETITALNAKTGSQIWTKELVGDYFSNFTIANGIIYIGGRYIDLTNPGIIQAAIHALDLKTGNREWSHLLDASNLTTSPEGMIGAGTPVVSAGKIFTTTYPAGSILDHHYIQYSNFFVLEASNSLPDGERIIASQSK